MSPLVTRKKRIFLLSSFKDNERKKITNMIHDLGGTVTELTDDFKATHLVVPFFRITPKMVAALAAGIWIVHTSYILQSYRKGSWELEFSYEIGSSYFVSSYNDIDPTVTLWEDAPRQCREKALVKRKPNLTAWKVGLLIDEPMELHILKSILKAGGASVVILKSPFNNKIREIDKNSVDFVVVNVSDPSSVPPSLYENIQCVTFHFVNDSLCMDPPPEISKYDFQRCENKGKFVFKESSGGKTPSYDVTEASKGFGGRRGRTFSTQLEKTNSTQEMHLNGKDNFNISVNTQFGCPPLNSDLFLNVNISTNVEHRKKTMNSVNLSLSKIRDDKASRIFYANRLCDTMNGDTLDQRTKKRESEFPESPSRKRMASSRFKSPGKRRKNFSTQTNTLFNYYSFSNDKLRSEKLNNFASEDLCIEGSVDVSEQRAFKRKDNSLHSEDCIILSSDEESNVCSRTPSKMVSVVPQMFSDSSNSSRLHLENFSDHQKIRDSKDCIKLKYVNGAEFQTQVFPAITILSDKDDNNEADINSEIEIIDLCSDDDIGGEVLVNECAMWEERKCGFNEGKDDNYDHFQPPIRGIYSDELNYIPSKPCERKSTCRSINRTNEDTFDIDEEIVNHDENIEEKDTPFSEDYCILCESETDKRTDPFNVIEDGLSDSELPIPPCIPHVELSIDNLLSVSPIKYSSSGSCVGDKLHSSFVKDLPSSSLLKDLPPNSLLKDKLPSSLLKDLPSSSLLKDLPSSSPPGSQNSFAHRSPHKDLPYRSALKVLPSSSSSNDLPPTSPTNNLQLSSHKTFKNRSIYHSVSEKYNFGEDDIIFESVSENCQNYSPLPSSHSKSINVEALQDSDSNLTIQSGEEEMIFNNVPEGTMSVVNNRSSKSLLRGTESQDFILNESSVDQNNSEVNQKDLLEKDPMDNVNQHISSNYDTGSKTSKALVLTAEKLCKTQADCYLSKLHNPWIEMGAYSIPQCIVHGAGDCNLEHGKKRTSLELEHFDENFLLEAVCPSSAIELLQGRIDFGIYPSSCLVQHTLLCTMDRWNEIGIDALLCLHSLLQIHPPCAVGMLDYYKKIFFSPVTEMTARASDGVFWYCLTKLEEALNVTNGQLYNNGFNQFPIREEFLDSIIFPAVNRTNRDSVGLLNSEKLDQLFNCLDYFNDVMESDLNVGLLKNLSNPKRYVCKNGKPLIAVALWGKNTVGSVNVKCKQIMKLFLNCYKRCSNKMYSLSFNRIMCSMAQVVYVSERNSTPPMYPNVGTNCRDLANSFSTHIMESDLNMVEVCTLLRSLRPNWFRLCVCCSLIEKLNGRNIDISLQPMVSLLKDLKTVNPEFPSHETASHLSLLQVDEEPVLTENVNEVSQLFLKKALKKDKKGETRLHITCRCNRFTEVEELLKVPNINVNEKDNAGFTPLHEASLHGSIDCVKLLLNHHTPSGGPAVDPRAKTSEGVTPLMDAVKRNHLEIASMLLEYGGQDLLLDKDEKGNSAWDMAFTNEMKNIFMNAPETSKCSALSTVPLTLRLKLVTLVPDMILFYLKFSEVRRIENELRNNNCDETVMNGVVSVKFSPLNFKQDYGDYKTLRGVVKQMLNSKVNLIDRLIFVL